MSSLALMRWLESTPERYDAGMRAITFGRVAALHDAVAEEACPAPGCHVLEVGCGTGAVTLRLLERGARVTALDQDPAMLEQARQRIARTHATGDLEVQWLERTASEIDALARSGFDSVVFSLSLSEMASDERRFVLREARERLMPHGRLIAADEVRADSAVLRIVQSVLRGPQTLLAWLLAGSDSKPLARLRAELEEAGYRIVREQRWLGRTLALFVCEAAT